MRAGHPPCGTAAPPAALHAGRAARELRLGGLGLTACTLAGELRSAQLRPARAGRKASPAANPPAAGLRGKGHGGGAGLGAAFAGPPAARCMLRHQHLINRTACSARRATGSSRLPCRGWAQHGEVAGLSAVPAHAFVVDPRPIQPCQRAAKRSVERREPRTSRELGGGAAIACGMEAELLACWGAGLGGSAPSSGASARGCPHGRAPRPLHSSTNAMLGGPQRSDPRQAPVCERPAIW